MEDLRDNNYGYELPNAILELVQECEEDEDEERLEALDNILDLCDHTDLKMLKKYAVMDDLLNDYMELRDDSGALLEFILTKAQRENRVL